MASQHIYSQQWILFCAQEADALKLNPHAFVCFYQIDPATKKVVESANYGFNTTSVSMLPSFYGEGTASDNSQYRKDHTFLIAVSPKEFNYCLAIVGTYRNQKYLLAYTDCVKFIDEIAQSLKARINIPTPRPLIPSKYIQDLKTKNLIIDKESRVTINKRNQDVNSSTGWINYVYTKNTFKLAYPLDWEFHEDFEGAKIFLRQSNKAKSKLDDSFLTVFEVPITEKIDLGIIKSNLSKNISYLRKPQILKLEERINNGFPGIYAEFTYKDFKYDMHEIS